MQPPARLLPSADSSESGSETAPEAGLRIVKISAAQRLAVYNGQPVSERDVLDGGRVVHISEQGLAVQRQGKREQIALLSADIIKKPIRIYRYP